LRSTVQIAKDASKDVAEHAALALPEIARALDGKAPKRVIVVPNRVVNVVL
jgi:leucyl-tRNA synthetase